MAFRLRTPELAWIGFAIAAFAAVALIGLEVRGATFYGDEWGFLFRLADEPLATAMFDPPPGKYLVAVPIAAYAALAELFGIDSYLPYRLLGLALLVLAAGLLFELARRRAGYWWALPSAAILLFLGSAWEVVVIPGRIPSQFAICAGLGMVLALDRRDVRGDLAAAILAVIALTSHPVALAFMAAAAVTVVLGDPVARWRRSWTFAAPLLLYGLWYLAVNDAPAKSGETSFSTTASFAADGFVALAATLSGTFREPWTGEFGFINGWSVALAIGFALVAAIAVARRRSVSTGLAAAVVALATSLIAPALEPSGLNVFRDPTAPRYLYPGAVFVLWVVVELVAMRPFGGGARVLAGGAAAALLASGLYSNITTLEEIADRHVDIGRSFKTGLGALDLVRDRGPGESSGEPADGVAAGRLDALIFSSGTVDFAAERLPAAAPAYFAISNELGSAGFDASALSGLPEPYRQQADRTISAVVPITLSPAESERARHGGPAPVGAISEPSIERGEPCQIAITSDHGASNAAAQPIDLPAPPARVWLRSDHGPPPPIRVGRLADEPVVPLSWPEGAWAATLSLPTTGLGRTPWKLELAAPGRITVCSV